MMLRTETQELLHDVERSANKKLGHPEAVGVFLESARSAGKMELFLEAAFLAKFVTKSFGIMKRIGVDGEGYDKLNAESESNLAKASSLLRSLNENLPEDLRRKHEALFFSLTPESLGQFLALLVDLTAVKNWTLDGGRLPDSGAGTKDKE
ncbi:MAG: hypothetical protein A2X66_04120 [Ignavibacteria bacterium GWA2_54_16]|nr:MAG: hypothetical protein A2X66_04120 [Ignavibacteria bacterium GWA2_54_16]